MTRNIKALGLALVAVLAISAIAAAGASAQFESEAEDTIVTRSSNSVQVIKYQAASGVTVECAAVTGTGTITGKATTSITFAPEYSECKNSLGGSATVIFTTGGCKYTFTSAKGSTAITADLGCTSSVTVIVKDNVGVEICKLHIGSQTVKGTVTGSNIGAGTTREVKITANNKEFAGTRTGSALCGPAASTSGTYVGDVTVTGETAAKAHVGIFMD